MFNLFQVQHRWILLPYLGEEQTVWSIRNGSFWLKILTVVLKNGKGFLLQPSNGAFLVSMFTELGILDSHFWEEVIFLGRLHTRMGLLSSCAAWGAFSGPEIQEHWSNEVAFLEGLLYVSTSGWQVKDQRKVHWNQLSDYLDSSFFCI